MRPAARKPIILTFAAHYLPGFKGGGAIKSISSLVRALEGDFEFKVITSDRDCGDVSAFAGVERNRWHASENGTVYYLPLDFLAPCRVFRAIKDADFDVIYLNSFFNPWLTIIPLLLYRLKLIKQVPIIVAPRGEFQEGAVSLKRFKKNAWLRFAGLFGIYAGVVWQASSDYEKNDIERTVQRFTKRNVVPGRSRVVVAPDMVVMSTIASSKPPVKKEAGLAKLLFMSRITPKKNLDFALDVLMRVGCRVIFDIYGPIDDLSHWRKCGRLIAAAPENVKISYGGALKPGEVQEAFAQHHLFLFPTRGENFGHVIVEAFAAGCPVLLSDQTPWTDLQTSGAGRIVPLSEPERYRECIEQIAELDDRGFQKLRESAYQYAAAIRSNNQSSLSKNREMFLDVMKLSTCFGFSKSSAHQTTRNSGDLL